MDTVKQKNALIVFVLALASMVLWNCALAREDRPDNWPTQNWRTSKPESQGMDSSIIGGFAIFI